MRPFDRPSYAEHLASLADNDPSAPAWLMPGRETMSRAALAARIDDAGRRFGEWGIGRGDIVAWPVIERDASSLLAVVPAITTLAPLAAGMTPEAYARTYERLGVKAVVLPRGVRHAAAEAADRAGSRSSNPWVQRRTWPAPSIWPRACDVDARRTARRPRRDIRVHTSGDGTRSWCRTLGTVR
jgi:hypothetical protein